jgi:tetratricopeptide (TPR) repeat protein
MSATRKRLALGLLVVAGVGAAAWWFRSASADQLGDVRNRVGTHSATPVLARLREELPGSAEVFFLSARQARLEDKAEEASAHLTQAERLGWPGPAVERERTLVRAASDPRRARPVLEALLAADPSDADALLALAQVELQTGKPERAVDLADRVLRDSPTNGRALYVRGSAWARARRLDLARADLETAVATGPDALNYRPAQVALGSCLLDLGEFTRALELFRAVRADEPTNLLALFGVGRASS